MARNERASTDARHARTGKDGAIFDAEGVLMATVDTFNAQSSFSNAKYSVLGDPQEHETANTFGITISMSSVVIESDSFIQEIVEFMRNPEKYHTGVFRERSWAGMAARNASCTLNVYRQGILICRTLQ